MDKCQEKGRVEREETRETRKKENEIRHLAPRKAGREVRKASAGVLHRSKQDSRPVCRGTCNWRNRF